MDNKIERTIAVLIKKIDEVLENIEILDFGSENYNRMMESINITLEVIKSLSSYHHFENKTQQLFKTNAELIGKRVMDEDDK